MSKTKSVVGTTGQEYREEDSALSYEEYGDRVVVLKKEPRSRKTMLIESGVKEVRCISCVRVKPIATAEEAGDGWICEDCLSEAEETPRYGGQRGK
jgi:hypothetical protein